MAGVIHYLWGWMVATAPQGGEGVGCSIYLPLQLPQHPAKLAITDGTTGEQGLQCGQTRPSGGRMGSAGHTDDLGRRLTSILPNARGACSAGLM